MPYILLILGIFIGVYALYRFFLSAQPHQIIAFFQMSVVFVLCGSLIILALTGRLPTALGFIAAMTPFVLAWWQNKNRSEQDPAQIKTKPQSPMTRKEALEILGLEDGATPVQIRAAHKRIIKKVHPDHEGSDWLAARVHEAKSVLLDE